MKPHVSFLERFAQQTTQWAGSSLALVIAFGVIAVWLVSGPFFNFSDTWQLVINTGTTVVTFLMVFLLQRAQNKESLAIQLKLNELIAALEGASQQLINAEDMSEAEARALHEKFQKLANAIKMQGDPGTAHSIQELENACVNKPQSADPHLEPSAPQPKNHANKKADIGLHE